MGRPRLIVVVALGLCLLSLSLASCSAMRGSAPGERASDPRASDARSAEEEPSGDRSTSTGSIVPKERWGREGKVGFYVSRPWSFSTSSYWIEGENGLIVIDTQFLPKESVEFVDLAERVTGKRVMLAIVLHANPDKFNGTKALQERGVHVVTSEQVKALIPAVHEKRVAAFYPRYKHDYPLELPAPESFGRGTMELAAGGVTVKAHVLGPGCSEAHVVVEHEGHLFAGDLVASKSHSWLEIGRTDEWLLRVTEMEALSPSRVHPGRGPSGGPELLKEQRRYLEKVIELVAAEKPVGEPDAAALARVKEKMEQLYPEHRFSVFLRLGLPAEWRRQASASRED